MIADIALICDSPIVLIDEIENAGIDKIKALDILTDSEKLILMVTHDPHTALMAGKRIVMKNGGVANIVKRTTSELLLFEQMDKEYKLRCEIIKQKIEGSQLKLTLVYIICYNINIFVTVYH